MNTGELKPLDLSPMARGSVSGPVYRSLAIACVAFIGFCVFFFPPPPPPVPQDRNELRALASVSNQRVDFLEKESAGAKAALEKERAEVAAK